MQPPRRHRRSIALIGVPADVREAYARAYPEFEWAEHAAPARPDRWDDLAAGFRAPYTPLALAPMAYAMLPLFARRGFLKPLDAVLSPEARTRYAPEALLLSTVDGRLCAVPDDVSVFALLIRRDAWKRIRMKPPRTWKDLELAWRALARETGGPVSLVDGLNMPGRRRLLLALLGANGADPAGAWDDLARMQAAALEVYAFMQRVRVLPGGDPFRVSLDALEGVRAGRLPGAFVDTGFLAKLPPESWTKLKALPMPVGPSCRQAYGFFMGSGWVVPQNTVAPDLALDVLETMREPERCVTRELSGGWGFPAVAAIWKDPRIARRFPVYREARAILGAAKPIDVSRLDMDLWTHAAETLEASLAEGADAAVWWERVRSGGVRRARLVVSHHLLRRAVEFIDAHLAEIDGVRAVARSVNRHHDYLNQLFRKHLKEGCGEYLKRRRMERARELLCDLTLTVKEIAAAVGMRNLSSFSRAFGDYWGCSATVLRGQLSAPPNGRGPAG
ncbi:MAG: extracellular solute-binding protein [Planctomycetota bacterium]|nr:extracellular solute-binding protein [Planctomycetota bacterium]